MKVEVPPVRLKAVEDSALVNVVKILLPPVMASVSLTVTVIGTTAVAPTESVAVIVSI